MGCPSYQLWCLKNTFCSQTSPSVVLCALVDAAFTTDCEIGHRMHPARQYRRPKGSEDDGIAHAPSDVLYAACCFFRQTRLSLSELLTTETELRAMAAAANSGLSRMPKKG